MQHTRNPPLKVKRQNFSSRDSIKPLSLLVDQASGLAVGEKTLEELKIEVIGKSVLH